MLLLLLLTLAMDWFVLTGVTITSTGHGLVCADRCYHYWQWPWAGLCLLVLLLLTLAMDWFVLTGVTTHTGCGLVCADRCYYYLH